LRSAWIYTIEELTGKMSALEAQANPNSNAINPASSVAANKLNIELSDKNIVVLNQNVPNPFAENTTITYNIPDDFT
jgi:hypothetical protein